ncbi:MAG: alginate export family protein [Kiritimatiellae bacterium]|nr:alginate export family protein [Kiritimatiellia bacterium]
MTLKNAVWAVALLAGTSVLAQEAGGNGQSFKVDGGGDLRLREEAFDDIPIAADPPGVTRGGENNAFRIRPRLWGSATYDQFTLFGRLTQEFRHNLEPDPPSAWDWPDEVIVDQLYLDGKGLMDGLLDVRVGRQDMIYGAGRVLLEGTPKDGSRTIYFDAAKLSWHLGDKTVVDLLGIYNRPEAGLEIGPLDRDVTGFDKYNNDMTESGGGVYAKINEIESVPMEIYYLFKAESCWDSFTNGVAPVAVEKPGRDTHTVGARVMPKLNDQFSLEFEGAAQFGETDDDNDVEGYMGYAGVSWLAPVKVASASPLLTAGCYYLSGDDPDTADDEGWNPLWARYPQFSELYVYAFDAEKAGYWSNLLYPSLTASLQFEKLHKIYLSAGMMMANEETGPGGGDARGALYVARYDFPLIKGLVGDSDIVYAHLLAEVLDPGDYYKVDDLAYFLRWEVVYQF